MEDSEYATMHRVEETHWWYRALRRITFAHLEHYLPAWRELAILDGGCGTGANLARLGNRRGKVGLDLAHQALTFCSQRGLSRLVRGTVTNLPFATGSFDAVLSTSVLYHRWVTDVDDALREYRRVLCDGGLLLLDLPAFNFLFSAHDEAVFTARRFTRREIQQRLKANGFSPLRTTYWNSLLFPLISLVRLAGLAGGRDFDRDRTPSGTLNRILDWLMKIEFAFLRVGSFPFGVSISCLAVKTPDSPRARRNASSDCDVSSSTAVHQQPQSALLTRVPQAAPALLNVSTATLSHGPTEDFHSMA